MFSQEQAQAIYDALKASGQFTTGQLAVIRNKFNGQGIVIAD